MEFGAVITAAGLSSRMKDFKPLLKIGEETFSRRIIGNFQSAGIEKILVVTGHRGSELEEALQGMGVSFVRNEKYETGEMFDSVVLGLEALKTQCDSVFVCPVDVPFFTVDTLRKMINVSAEGDVIIPRFQGRSGHPVLLSKRALDYVIPYAGEGGLRRAFELMETSGIGRRLFVPVEDRGICFDADTPEDYRKCLEWEE